MNEVLLLATLVLYFGGVFLAERVFGERGLVAFIAMASIMANLELCIGTTFFMMECTLGNVAFASIFLCVDALNEKYGKESADKGIAMVAFIMVFQILISTLNKGFSPSSTDIASEAYRNLFQFSFRINATSLACFLLAIWTNSRIFNALKRKTDGRLLWLRNNASTIVTNCGENLLFYSLAFAGTMAWKEILSCVLATSVLELVIALLDTPFLYLIARRKPCH